MSYAGAGQARPPTSQGGSVRGSPRPGTGLVGRTLGGDSVYVEDTRKIQDTVKRIQQYASDIRKEARNADGPHAAASQKKVQDIVRTTKTAEDEAKRMLQSLAVSGAGTPSEQNMRRLTQQKLSESLVQAVKAFGDSWKAYETAVAESTARGKQKVVPQGRSNIGVEMFDVAGTHAPDVEDQQMQRQQQELDVTEAEVETHTAIVEEMVQDVTSLNSEIRGLQRAMVDLAQTTTAQGETLDSIESHMSRSVTDTSGATEQLVQASTSQRQGNKMLCCMVVVCLILCISIIIVVLLKHH